MKKLTHEEYLEKLFIKEIDSIPLEEYKGDGICILHECINGHKTLRSPSNVLERSRCSVCANTAKCNTESYLNKLSNKSINNRPIEDYINTDTPIYHKCINGHEWKIAPKYILAGRECPSCANKTGFYCENFFKNNPEAGKQPGILYIVVLVNKNTYEKVCVKIGITKGTSNKDVIARTAHFKGYETRIQKTVYGPLEEIYYLEQYLHELWADNKYTSEWKFGGYSELFNIEILSEILKSLPSKL